MGSQSFNTTIKMKSVQSLAVLGFAAAAQASYGYGWNTTSSEPVVYTTLTTDIYTTYCPEATTFTITDCPCTATNTYPGTTSTITIGTTTTYCPVPTTIITGGSTYPVTTPGTVTIPICSTTVVPITTYPA